MNLSFIRFNIGCGVFDVFLKYPRVLCLLYNQFDCDNGYLKGQSNDYREVFEVQ